MGFKDAKNAYDSDKWWPAGLPEWIGAQTDETLRALDKGLRSFGWPAYNVPQPLPREDSWPGISLGLAQLIRESEVECGRLREQAEQWERRCEQAYERFDAASNDAMQANLASARLREQLDAARQALERIARLDEQTEAYHFNDTALVIARAALGVVGGRPEDLVSGPHPGRT